MALTRKALKAMGLTEEQVDSIVEQHSETVEALKAERDAANQRSADFDKVNAELEKLKANGGNWEQQYNALKGEFDTFKENAEKEKTNAKKTELLNAMLTEAGINRDSIRALISKSYDINGIELAEDGTAKNRADLLSAIKADYADFIGKAGSEGTPSQNPPSGGNNKPLTLDDVKKMSAEQINANWAAVSAALANK